MSSLSIIIPAYNEGAHIDRVVRDVMHAREIFLKSNQHEIEIVVVNDGSTDTTQNELSALGKENFKSVNIVEHYQNRGYGAALKTGFEAAKGEYLSFMDGDGTIEPSSIFLMYEKVMQNKADMAVGLRFSDSASQMPLTRKLGNIFFARLLSFLAGRPIKDTASGVRVFRRDILAQLYPLPDGLHFTPAMSTKALHENLDILEIPIDYRNRHGESKLSVLKDGMRFLNIIVGTVLMYNPFKVFFSAGLLFIIAAALLMMRPFLDLIGFHSIQFSDYLYRSIAAFCLLIGGIQIILFGILARFMVSTFFKRYESGKLIHKINAKLKVYHRMAPSGLLLLSIGTLTFLFYWALYIKEGDLNMHWSWLMSAAFIFVLGLQMTITGVVMRILADIKDAIEFSTRYKL